MECVIDISKQARDDGVIVYEYPFESINGCIYKKGDGYRIGIKEDEDLVQKRMILAHELAHFKDETVGIYKAPISEKRAYKIARELLIPEVTLKKLVKDGYDDFSTLSSMFGVSVKMIELRCRDVFIF
jgi:Zn-dependent peptidase ImmA (M78 family)